MEPKIHNLSVLSSIDVEFGVKFMGDQKQYYYAMMESFEAGTLRPSLTKMAKYYDEKNWAEFQKATHGLKGTSATQGAAFLHYNCYYMQMYFLAKDIDSMLKYYPSAVESALEYIYHAKILRAEPNEAVHTSEDKRMPVG